MGFDVEDLERIAKITALIQAGLTELGNILANKQAQAGKSEQEIFDHAEQANIEARKMIEAL